MIKNARHICDKCIYNRLGLPGIVIHFEYNISNSESANVMEMLLNQIHD